jgi:hypothetical protein
MLTWQHGSLKDRESLLFHEQVQGERTSVPSSGVGDDPRATTHRGRMVLRATASRLICRRTRIAPDSNSKDVSDHSTLRQSAARRALSFNHQR